ncbi:protein ACCELERATED CELL DEATH 6-like [Quercus lobata]|nr:protein ACCELERATED CELL DEATH 6-like [Quercus lobata]
MGNKEFVKLLLEKLVLEKDMSPAYVRNEEGLSVLHIAAKKGNVDVMEQLMEACPDMSELLDKKGRNVLHAAAESGMSEVFRFFKGAEFGSLINEQDEEGNTPMHLVAINGHHWNVLHTSVQLNITNDEGFTNMDYFLLEDKLQDMSPLWWKGCRPSLRGALLKMGIRSLDPRSKRKLAVDVVGDDKSKGKEGSVSDFWKRMSEANLLVVTLIATVTFAAAFTMPGGYNQNESENGDAGLAVLRKRTAFGVFLIANTLAFGLSTTSVFLHFFASATIKDDTFHKKVARRISFYTNWSIGALLLAFIAGTYTVVPHSLGITVAVLLCGCFLSNMLFPLSIKKEEKLLFEN